MMMCRILFKTL